MQVELAWSWEKHFREQYKARRLRMEQSALRHEAATIAAAAVAAEKKAAALVAAERAAAEAAAEASTPTTPLTTIAPPRPSAKPSKYPPITLIIDVIANHYGIQSSEIIGHRRTARQVEPRHIAFYLFRILTPCSLTTIGRCIGNRDHTSALYAFRKIERKAKCDADLAGMLEGLARLITKLHAEQNG